MAGKCQGRANSAALWCCSLNVRQRCISFHRQSPANCKNPWMWFPLDDAALPPFSICYSFLGSLLSRQVALWLTFNWQENGAIGQAYFYAERHSINMLIPANSSPSASDFRKSRGESLDLWRQPAGCKVKLDSLSRVIPCQLAFDHWIKGPRSALMCKLVDVVVASIDCLMRKWIKYKTWIPESSKYLIIFFTTEKQLQGIRETTVERSLTLCNNVCL